MPIDFYYFYVPVEPENDTYPFFGEINNKNLFNFKVIFSLCNTVENKTLIILSITCKKANIHDTSKNFHEKRKQERLG